jgi:predicted DNA binding CopG/RHH family protein
MKKLSEMTDDELLAASDEVERQARDRSQWTETAESKSNESQREAWLEDNTVPITMRIPKSMLVVLRAIAAAEGIGYQTLIKKWLHRDLLTLAKSRGEKKQETLLRSLEGRESRKSS